MPTNRTTTIIIIYLTAFATILTLNLVLLYFSINALFPRNRIRSYPETLLSTALLFITCIPLATCLGVLVSAAYYVAKSRKRGGFKAEKKVGMCERKASGIPAVVPRDPLVPGTPYECLGGREDEVVVKVPYRMVAGGLRVARWSDEFVGAWKRGLESWRG